MKFKFFLIFLVSILIGFTGFAFYILTYKNPGKPIKNIIQTIAKPTLSIADAPSESIRGNIIQMTGNINWESRTATESSALTSPITLQQGEEIQTGDGGQMKVEFPGAAILDIMPKTQIDFVQTLPVNFTASIASGSAIFTKSSNIPVSVRALHLLIREDMGQMNVTVDEINGFVDVKILSGSITTAFNDTNNVSNTASFQAPKEINFNDLTREFTF